MKPKSLTIVFALALAACPVFAQMPDASEGDAGPGVARISVMNGEVSVRRGDSGDLIAAAINAPLVVTDRLLTGPNSRAEVQFDWADMIRVGANSEIRLGDLEYKRYQVQVAVGTTTFRVLRDTDAQIEISTPSVSVRPLRKGIYRVTVLEDGSSEITVRSGEADIYTPTGSQVLKAGETMLARGAASEPEYQIQAAIPLDEWDNWNESRDRFLDRSRSYQYVSRDVYGAEDLDGYGSWVDVDSYGWVWRPAVAAGWAPYRYGRWAWVDYYGWTWVSYDPWGWAPYHYGRWFYASNYGWCWWPGQMRMRHYWQPALVAFFGWGGHHGGVGIGVGFGWGNIGWVPLAPYERYHPWYGRGWYGGRQTVVNNITVVNNTNIFNSYRNGRRMDAITAVDSGSFGRSPVGNHNVLRVSHADLQNVNVVRGALPFTPTRESVRYADRTVRAGDMPRVADNRRFFSRRQSSPAQTVPFEQQRAAVERIATRTFGGPSGRTDHVQGSASPARAAEATPAPGGGMRGGAEAPTRSGWRRAGEISDQRGVATSPNVRSREGIANDTGRSEMRSQPGRGAADNGRGAWRPFGGRSDSGTVQQRPQASAPRAADPPQRSAPSYQRSAPEAGGWQPFGQGRGRSESASPAAPRSERSAPSAPSRMERSAPSGSQPGRGAPGRGRADNSGWMRFSDSGSDRSRSSSFDAGPRAESPRTNSPQRYDSPRSPGQYSRSPEPIRINPPIVRERSQPRSQYRGDSGFPGYGGFGGNQYPSGRSSGGFSAPRSAPRSESRMGGFSTPSHGGGFSAPSRSGGFSSRGGGFSAGRGMSSPRSETRSSGGSSHFGGGRGRR